MAILPGFEYDIFISYRHNDNRSGWVTEFVKALQEELAATIKESVSVYFDTNPHDGLLETHNVDKSLEGKLRCLIFIPIISQTYCDTKSFAWQHEFCAFNKIAKEDQFGRDIKLSNGNVASRILPVKIHDLDTEDKALLENELRGVLRAIEFILKSAGVNRPLTSKDDEVRTPGKILYRDQVNKVANAIKEIITSLKNTVTPSISTTQNGQPSTQPVRNRKKLVATISFFLVLSAIVYFLYPKLISEKKEGEILDKSIAVLPFVNMSNDPNQEYFSDGISEEVLNLLTKVPELKVIGRTSSFYFKGKNEDLRTIGEKLGAAHVLEGSVRKDGNRIRITAQLIRSADGTRLWSERYDRQLENIFDLQDEIAGAVLKQLKLKLLGSSSLPTTSLNNKEIHNLLLQGNYFHDRGGPENFSKANEFYEKALAIDSGNARIWAALAKVKIIQGVDSYQDYHKNYSKAREYTDRAVLLDNQSSEAHQMMGRLKLYYDLDWQGAEREFGLALELEPGNSDAYRNLAQVEWYLGKNKIAIEHFKKALELNPLSYQNINIFAFTHLSMSKYEDAILLFKKGLELNPLASQGLVYAYLLSDKPNQALNQLETLTNGSSKTQLSVMCYYALSREREANDALNTLLNDPSVASYRIARIYAFMNQKDKAFQWLEKACTEKYGMPLLKSDYLLYNLRDDPRYTDLLRRMNLPLD